MPTLNLTLSVPTQAEVDDFCTNRGWNGIGTKADFIKAEVARYIKECIKSQRVVVAKAQTDASVKTAYDAQIATVTQAQVDADKLVIG